MPIMRKVIDGGFRDPSLSDFQIQCHERIFFAHRVVLQETEYFANLLAGTWKEALEGRLDLSEWNPAVVESMLRFIYGESFADLSKALPRPDNVPPSGRFIVTGTRKLFRSMHNSHDYYISEPSLEVADFYCHSLEIHGQIYVMAERYQLPDLRRGAYDACHTLRFKCWNNPGILDIIAFVIESLPNEEGKKENKILPDLLIFELCRRLDMLAHSKALHNIIAQIPSLLDSIIAQLDTFQPQTVDLNSMCYCAGQGCHKNNHVYWKRGKWFCRACRSTECLYDRARRFLWTDAQEDEYSSWAIDTNEFDTSISAALIESLINREQVGLAALGY